MVSSRDNPDNYCYIIAFTLNNAADSKVSVRIMNLSDSLIQVYKGQKITQFQPVLESISIQTQLSSSQICGSINCVSSMGPGTFKELEDAINPQLPPNYQKALLNTLLNLPDVFSNGLVHTSIAEHMIETGDFLPIRPYPRRLPCKFCVKLTSR